MRFVLFAILLSSVPVLAAQVTLTSGQDKYCFTLCYNTDELVFSPTNRAYIRFDVSSIPDRAEIESARLELSYRSAAAGVQLARLSEAQSSWEEGNEAQPSAVNEIGTLRNLTCCPGKFGLEEAALAEVVSQWVSGSFNNGLVIDSACCDFSAHSGETPAPPRLVVEYSVPCIDNDGDGFGVGDCPGPIDCNDSDPDVYPGAPEVCNYIDDDCSGIADDTGYPCATCEERGGYICNATEVCGRRFLDVHDSDICCPEPCYVPCIEGARRECGIDKGACTKGYQVCTDGQWGPCWNETQPTAEICNGLDDDCDGIIDNVEDPWKCQCFNGSAPGPEILDGKDNNCNGRIDEGWDCVNQSGSICPEGWTCPGTWVEVTDTDRCCSVACMKECLPGQSRACGSSVGACREGIMKCINGTWTECMGGVGPTNETCNNIDDDCNGIVDDIDGLLTIEATKCRCTQENPRDELCNGIDDDCNGLIDDSCVPEQSQAGTDEPDDGPRQISDDENQQDSRVFSPIVIGAGSLAFIIAGVVIYFFLHKPKQQPLRQPPMYSSPYSARQRYSVQNSHAMQNRNAVQRTYSKSAHSIRARIDEKFR